MSSSSSFSHGAAWSLGIVAALLLYVLSVPPLIAIKCDPVLMAPPPPGVKTAWSINRSPPVWLAYYIVPSQWLSRIPGLGEPLTTYADWVYGLPR
jgi:hypothetical protein